MKLFCKTSLIVFVFLAGMLVFPQLASAGRALVWEYQWESLDQWEADGGFAGGTVDETDVTHFAEALEDIVAGDNLWNLRHWGEKHMYIPTGVEWSPNTTYTVDFIVARRSSWLGHNPPLLYGLADTDDDPWLNYLGTRGNFEFANLGELQWGWISEFTGGQANDVSFEFTTGEDVSGLGDMYFFIRHDTGAEDNYAWGANIAVYRTVPATITEQPQLQRVSVGENADFEVQVELEDPAYTISSYQWYYSATPVAEPGTDVALSGEDSSVLSLTNIQEADAGYYYCVVSFDSTGGSFELTSDTAKLVVGSKIAHWTLDLEDFVGGEYLDSVDDRHAVPEVVPSDAAFVDAMVGEGLDLAAYPDAVARAGTDSPAELNDEMTIALWMLWDGPDDPDPTEAGYQGIVSKRGYVEDPEDPEELTQVAEWYWQINPAGDNIIVNSWAGDGISTDAPAIGEWVHFAFTFDDDGAALYRNGSLDSVQPNFVLDDGTAAELLLGGLNVTEPDEIYGVFNGVIDDVKIYNYALTNLEVAEIVFDDSGIRGCVEDYRPELDWTGDCIVGFGEFSALAQYWLHDGLTSTE